MTMHKTTQTIATKVWDCHERMFTYHIKRWDGSQWREIPVEERRQFQHIAVAYGRLRLGDVIAVHNAERPRALYQVRRYQNRLILAPIAAPETNPLCTDLPGQVI